MKAHLEKYLFVEAAHRNLRGGEKQRRLHGHSYQIEVLAEGTPDPSAGWIVDFAELKRLFRPIYDRLDHAYLNTVPGLEEDASLPALQRWIEDQLVPMPAWMKGARVSIIGACAYRPVVLPEDPLHGLPQRVYFTFEAAQSLPHLPETHQCRQIHGHSYRVEVGGADLGALERDLAAIYDLLDHTYLNEISGLETSTVEHLCDWIWKGLADGGHTLTVVGVQETNTSRCLYFGET
ncbi:MAG: 6-carboxytetrahydropterin synthase [Candidatus Hydrogenedentes bacterium]|nr:6-carboxytetrahydropterin synthase [Candidatus Hydrogenedentota bacterium]